MQAYVSAKLKMFNNQDEKCIAVINNDQEVTRWVGNHIKNKVLISTKEILNFGISVIDKVLYDNGKAYKLAELSRLVGQHNAQNIAAAFAAAKSYGLSPEKIIEQLYTFAGLPHRMEVIGKYDNVTFINDSKATNVDSAEKSLATFKNIYWIAGGVSKETNIKDLKHVFANVKKAYLVGDAQNQFAIELNECGLPNIKCDNMETAMTQIKKDLTTEADKEASVLLAPACASFDHFANFEERGDWFRKMVEYHFMPIVENT